MSTEPNTTERARRPAAVGPDEAPAFGWRRLQIIAAVAVVASLVIPMLITLSFEPFLVAMAAPFVVGLLVALRWPRPGAIVLGVLSLAILVFSAPFLLDALTHPEALADFVPLVLLTVSAVVAAAAAIPAFREAARHDARSSRPRYVALAAAGVVAAAAVASVISFVGIENESARAGDIRVETRDVLFAPTNLFAEPGTVSVHVTNRDATRHTFTIDQLGVDLNIPPNSTQRVTFEAAPGGYRFYCRPHDPGMQGTLWVE